MKPIILAFALAATSDVPGQPHDYQVHTADIRGTWNVLDIGPDGQERPGALTAVITGDTITLSGPTLKRPQKWAYQLGSKHSKDFDFRVPSGVWREGIYRRDGDRLLLCWGDEGSRPTAFKEKLGVTTLWTLRRR